ncbi:putative PurR-regulated permease PerM [Halanaeroarchaeum sp. HSR-CO]|uniref:AI-2E family transporter n=1 Tax=Halanaeroarchaeum sp. HSR-CO TaxID=2866382 RepID=UPI00217D4DCC|nr:AI-2E family transporter [Halanaeroarchaeum sp. HSR-CO]UWG49132.1 putative PurR-regulated permease PerM [Halanaeroarchaeum sp. HSR-CO]
MKPRRQALVFVLATTLLVATLVLHRVWGVVVFAVTIAYVLVPLQRRLATRGLSEWWASTVATVGGSVAALVPFLLAGYLGYRRRDSITGFLRSVPNAVEINVFGAPYVVDVEMVLEGVGDYLSATAVSIAGGLPELGLKATVFAFVVFGLLMSHEAVEDALMAAVPPEYRDVMSALAHRAEQTLYGIYVLQAATAAATFVIALVVFWGLGYSIPVTLAFLAGILQFVPIIGPSVLIVGLAAYHVAAGDVTAAVWVIVLAGFLVAWLPDVLVRPRLSKRTGNLAGTLYFVGFVGGLLTVGPIGIVVGPVAVALVAESMRLLAEENHFD